jgi:uncharacterized protein DUF5671
MTAIRRVYLYLLALAGLAMWSAAAAGLAQLVLRVLMRQLPGGQPDYIRATVSLDGAAVLVGLPVWLLHSYWIQRSARQDAHERASTLRRLYVYVVLAAAMVVLAVALNSTLLELFTNPTDAWSVVEPLPYAAMAALVWVGHWGIADADRRAVGESGGSATLRRWYVYGFGFVGFVMLLGGAQGVLDALWRAGAVSPSAAAPLVPDPAAVTLVGLGLWLLHMQLAPRWLRAPEPEAEDVHVGEAVRHQPTPDADDANSVLRSVFLFLALTVAVVGTLLGASQLLYYALARALGVDEPGGVGGNLLQAAAAPATIVLTYGAAWAYQRHAVRVQAEGFQEPTPKDGVARLYRYLVVLVSLGVLATGIAGVLWAMANLLITRDFAADQIALFATMIGVGLPVWLLHWRPRPTAVAETRSLARRLAVYLTLIAASLTLLGAAAAVVYRLIGLLLGSGMSIELGLDLAHALAVSAVAAMVAAYHWRILRQDARAAGKLETDHTVRSIVEIRAADAQALATALEALRATGVNLKIR